MSDRGFPWRRLGAVYGFLVAVQFLTRLPVPRDLDPEPEDLADSILWFPAVGTLVGGLLGGAASGMLYLPLDPMLVVPVVVVVGVVLTGAFHEDALGDALDGLVGAWERERVLEIMRDSRIGTYGTLGIVSAMVLRCGALLAMEPDLWPVALVVGHTLGRTTTGVMLMALPYARGEGENPGVGRLLRRAQTPARTAAATASGVGVAVVFAGGLGLIVSAVAFVICAVTGGYYRRRIGGMTGDCLGATNIAVEIAVLILFSALA